MTSLCKREWRADDDDWLNKSSTRHACHNDGMRTVVEWIRASKRIKTTMKTTIDEDDPNEKRTKERIKKKKLNEANIFVKYKILFIIQKWKAIKEYFYAIYLLTFCLT